MEELRQKFMTICTGCDGTGMFEEVYTTFGNEVKYREVECGCEDGKDLDWQKVDLEIKDTKQKIEINQMSIDNHNKFMREAMRNKHESKAIIALEFLMNYENKVAELEDYLEQLETIG
jgi:hypothetical protein